ncbi:MAG: hypothetical protein IJT11_04985 [Bacteroidaceae bacterium]|nr:hypothetical protein [Bacteroidaceae bacterium]
MEVKEVNEIMEVKEVKEVNEVKGRYISDAEIKVPKLLSFNFPKRA